MPAASTPIPPAGAQFGYSLLWTMIPMTLALVVVQEMCARMGAVTGKGLSDLIREEFGLRITFLMMIGLWSSATSATWWPSLPESPAAWNCFTSLASSVFHWRRSLCGCWW